MVRTFFVSPVSPTLWGKSSVLEYFNMLNSSKYNYLAVWHIKRFRLFTCMRLCLLCKIVNKKSLNIIFFSCREQFWFVRGSVAHRIYCAWPNTKHEILSLHHCYSLRQWLLCSWTLAVAIFFLFCSALSGKFALSVAAGQAWVRVTWPGHEILTLLYSLVGAVKS